MPDPSFIRVNRYRQRQRGKLPALPICPNCGRTITGTGRDGVCSICWKGTPAGREAEAARGRRRRAARLPTDQT